METTTPVQDDLIHGDCPWCGKDASRLEDSDTCPHCDEIMCAQCNGRMTYSDADGYVCLDRGCPPL